VATLQFYVAGQHGGEDLSRYLNKAESLGLRKCPYFTISLRKWCHSQ